MEIEQLIKIIKIIISKKYDKFLKISDERIKQIDELIIQIKNDIAHVDLKLLQEMLKDINKNNPDYDINKEIKYFQIIQFFKANSEKLSDSYKLTKEQEEYITRLIKQLIEQQKVEKANLENKNQLSNEIKQYTDLLENISNQENYIKEIDFINKILEEIEMDSKSRFEILSAIFKRNATLYQKRKTPSREQTSTPQPPRERINKR